MAITREPRLIKKPTRWEESGLKDFTDRLLETLRKVTPGYWDGRLEELDRQFEEDRKRWEQKDMERELQRMKDRGEIKIKWRDEEEEEEEEAPRTPPPGQRRSPLPGTRIT